MPHAQWTVTTTAGGISDPTTEESEEFTGWVKGVAVISPDTVDAGMTGTLTEVGGMVDEIWAGTIGAGDGENPTIRKYPVHDEDNPDDTDAGTKGLFYMSQQKLKLVLASAGSTPSNVTIRVKYIPDDKRR